MSTDGLTVYGHDLVTEAVLDRLAETYVLDADMMLDAIKAAGDAWIGYEWWRDHMGPALDALESRLSPFLPDPYRTICPICGAGQAPGSEGHTEEEHEEVAGCIAREGVDVIEGVIIEEVEFCDCTNEELERGRICKQPQCPNREENR